MSGPEVIDGLEFARNGRELRGAIEVARLERLREHLYDDAGTVEYALRGALNAHGKPVISIEASGALRLRCQRCLGPMPFRLDARRQLLLVQGTDELADPAEEDETVDSVPAQAYTDVTAMVEDEILLCLPISPRHADQSCAPPAAADIAAIESPFAALAKLKRPVD